MINWQEISTPPPVECDSLNTAIGYAQSDWYLGYLTDDLFIVTLNLIFDCVWEDV